MPFDWNIFERVVSSAYRVSATPYQLHEVLTVFDYFLERYATYRGEEHPLIRREQAAKYIRAMPYFYPEDHNGTQDPDIIPEWYPDMIDRYFQTSFPGCNYRMGHFFSGTIRENKYYEAILRGGWI